MSHTPGPWETSSSPVLTDTHPTRPWRTYVSSKNGFVGASNGKTIEEAGANGSLIAAAPDLLAALEELVNIIEGHLYGIDTIDGFTLQPARAAIAKARGEA